METELNRQVDLLEKRAQLDALKAELAEPSPEPVFAHSYLRKSEWGRYVLKQLGAE